MIIELNTNGLDQVLNEAQDCLRQALREKRRKNKDKKICEALGTLRAAYLMQCCRGEPDEENPDDSTQG